MPSQLTCTKNVEKLSEVKYIQNLHELMFFSKTGWVEFKQLCLQTHFTLLRTDLIIAINLTVCCTQHNNS